MNQKELNSAIQEAVKWLATENYYLHDFKQDLVKLKQNIKDAKDKGSVQEIKNLVKANNFLTKSESRANKYILHVEQILKELKTKITFKGTISEIETLVNRIEIEANQLIRDSAKYGGRLDELLKHLQTVVKDHEFEQAQQIIVELEQIIGEIEKWILALEVDFNKAKQISVNTPDINIEIVRKNKQQEALAELDHADYMLKQRFTNWSSLSESYQKIASLLDEIGWKKEAIFLRTEVATELVDIFMYHIYAPKESLPVKEIPKDVKVRYDQIMKQFNDLKVSLKKPLPPLQSVPVKKSVLSRLFGI